MAKIVSKGTVISAVVAVAIIAGLKRFAPQLAAKVGV